MATLHQNKKCDVIAHTLTSCGIPIWNGIPEKIIQDLRANGYKIKKIKNKGLQLSWQSSGLLIRWSRVRTPEDPLWKH